MVTLHSLVFSQDTDFTSFFFSAEDGTSKNGLVSYAYNLRHSLTKLEAAVTAVNEAIRWIDASQEASEDEYKEKQMELEAIVRYVWFHLILSSEFFFCSFIIRFSSPIIQKLYSVAHGSFPGADEDGLSED